MMRFFRIGVFSAQKILFLAMAVFVVSHMEFQHPQFIPLALQCFFILLSIISVLLVFIEVRHEDSRLVITNGMYLLTLDINNIISCSKFNPLFVWSPFGRGLRVTTSIAFHRYLFLSDNFAQRNFAKIQEITNDRKIL